MYPDIHPVSNGALFTRWRLASYSGSVGGACIINFTFSYLRILPTPIQTQQITETKGSDKDTLNLTRLKQFRAFYLIVVWKDSSPARSSRHPPHPPPSQCAYIYFTRLIVPVIETLLLYDKTWIAPFLGEFASFSFYWLSGQKFKPSQESPAEVHQGNNSDEELETQPMRREGTAVV